LPVAEPEARPRSRVRRGNEAVVERAGAATGTGAGVMKMVEPAEMPLPAVPSLRFTAPRPRCATDAKPRSLRHPLEPWGTVAEALQADAIGCMLPVSRGCGSETLAPISS
jgi:hypothetical protein